MKLWEWRVFFKDEFDLWQILSQKNARINEELKNTKVENRHDYYWNIGSQIYGLKERWTKVGDEYIPIVELKIRQEIDKKSGSEAWDKCLSIIIADNITEEGLTVDQMKRYLDILEGNKDYDNQVTYIKSQLDNANRIFVEKERKQIKYFLPNKNASDDENKTDSCLIELTELKNIIYDGKKIQGYRSICIEGPNLIDVTNIVTSLINQLNDLKGLKMGYPEFINEMMKL